jgi:ribulose-phosphate 3-epimerase
VVKKVRVVPAILTGDAAELERLVRLAESFTDYVQLDVMDGRFVPSRSVTCAQVAALHSRLRWEAHLMVLQPEDCLAEFRAAGAEKIVFHYEAAPSPGAVIRAVKKLGLGVGLAINPETPPEAIEGLVKELDSVLFLAVNPGFYGAKFIPEVLDKIKPFRRAHPGVETGIDGGVKEGNIAAIARAGADVIYVGSAIFLQPDPAASYRRLQALAAAAAPAR